MFSFLPKKNIFFIKKDDFEKLDSEIPSQNEKENQELITVNEDEIVKIKIEKCLFQDFLKCGHKIDKYNICLRNFIYDGPLSPDTILEKQEIYIIEKENKKYLITLNTSQTIISEYTITDENIKETQLKINLDKNQFEISKYIHDLNYSTIETKFYPTKNELYNQYFVLDKIEAYSLIDSLLRNLESIKNINDIIDLCDVYKLLNLIPSDYFTPVISDGELSLSWVYSEKDKELNKQKYVLFDIVLNDTKEVVGDISFDYGNAGFSYVGNVSYEIKRKYRNMHYATKALSLLKKVLQNHEFEGDKDLYISTVPENIKSQKVIQNNDGNLIYEGPVPNEELIYCVDGVKDVKVYRIDMNKKS